ncbi:sex plus protein [Rhizopus microsporus ATCC 52813]|uniref:Sex plus protein n=1 Tax=Rhizopus microsporus ATCC 52813 TaxID=1340429 RepID=A0A2G4SK26_RHIZD|nr:sex plus protein [Rhizopus microsporus ATCC 52813]PHZ09124.1 sex plus protein [Rhizopus microsporus ATCC 52813]
MKQQVEKGPMSPRRLLKPKISDDSSKVLPVDDLLLLQEQGETSILISPSNVRIKAKDILNMIDNRQDFITLPDNDYCILRNDIFSVLHAYGDRQADQHTVELFLMDIDFDVSTSKRPTNAFILYRTAWGKTVRSMFPEFNNSQISKILGAMWKWSGNQVKDKYIQRANEYRKIHKEKYPNFVYSTKRVDKNKQVSATDDHHFECNYADLGLQGSMVNQLVHSGTADDNKSADALGNNFCSNNNYSGFTQKQNFATVSDISNSEWQKVCDLVLDILSSGIPEDSVIDDQYWDILQNVDLEQSFFYNDWAAAVNLSQP